MAGLGKGLDALIPQDFDQTLLIDAKDRVQKVLTSSISPNPDQPRRVFDDAALGELAKSLKQYGILQPLIVVRVSAGHYRLVAGERRWRAAGIAGINEVPVIVRQPEELQELEIALIENVQRVDLSPLEQAISIERLHQQFNLSYKEIASRLSKAETTVSNLVRLLQLPIAARDALTDSKISEGHARTILSLKSLPDKQAELLASIIEKGWSVRQAEQFVVTHRQGVSQSAVVKKRMATETTETKRIAEKYNTKISLRRTAKGGKIELHFTTEDDLNRLLNILDRPR